MNYIMLLGTLASVTVAVSLTMKNIRLLRIVNLAGASLFFVYGYLIGALPVVIVNLFIVGIDIYYIIGFAKSREKFDFIQNISADDQYTKLFLKYYIQDIRQYFPDFSSENLDKLKSAYVLRDMVPVLLMLYREPPGEDVEILLDYATPHFRDYKSSGFFFDYVVNRLNFEKSGKKYFRTYSGIKSHEKYLLKMGFVRTGETDEFRKRI